MTVQEHGLGFDCAGERLVGVLSLPDAAEAAEAPGRLALLIAVGGPQYRAGSHRQFALLARRLAAAGHPVLRFDCRGMGDSTGEFPGFEALGADLAAAAAALQRAVPGTGRIVLWGLCDAASAALMNATGAHPWAGLVLLNPWVRHVDTHARTQVKHYYKQRLADPAFWRKLASGKVDIGTAAREFPAKLARTAASYLRPAPAATESEPADFRERMARGALGFAGPQLYILSGRDHTCAEFLDYAGAHPRLSQLWSRAGVQRLDLGDADHTFSSQALRGEVERATLDFLRALGPPAPARP